MSMINTKNHTTKMFFLKTAHEDPSLVPRFSPFLDQSIDKILKNKVLSFMSVFMTSLLSPSIVAQVEVMA